MGVYASLESPKRPNDEIPITSPCTSITKYLEGLI